MGGFLGLAMGHARTELGITCYEMERICRHLVAIEQVLRREEDGLRAAIRGVVERHVPHSREALIADLMQVISEGT
jgi:hypothetical protein